MAAVQDEIWVVSLILFYAFYLSHGFVGCFRGSFTHFIRLLPIDRVSQRLSCQLYALYPSFACTELSVTFQRLSHSPCALSCVSLHCQTVLYVLGQVAIHWDIDSGDQTQTELRGTH